MPIAVDDVVKESTNNIHLFEPEFNTKIKKTGQSSYNSHNELWNSLVNLKVE